MIRFSFAMIVGLLALGVQARLGEPAARQITETMMPTESVPVAAPNISEPTELDVAIANFALNLECLEAEFYSFAAYGYGLSEELRGGGPASIGGAKANLSEALTAYAVEIAENEIAHVKFLRAALGEAAVACPQVDIGAAFAAAADLALNTTLPLAFSPYFNDQMFLLGAFIFEDVGVTAYNGAAPLITSKSILAPAAGILAVEAYHAGTVRTLLSLQANFKLPPYMTATVAEVTQAISDLRASVGGGKDAGLWNVTSMPYVSTIVPCDENCIAYARTVAEVKAIVLLGSTDKGGFFPEGLTSSL